MKISGKTLKKLLCAFMLIILMGTFCTSVFAADVKPGDITADYKGDTTEFVNKAKNVAGFVRNFAIIASVIVIMVLGVKYILGSVEEKAEYKKSFMPLIIGIVLVVAATSIASFIFNMAA